MKSLYEINNGRTAFAAVRVYAWADTPLEALSLAINSYDERPSDGWSMTKLFSADAESFSTLKSSEGFEVDHPLDEIDI